MMRLAGKKPTMNNGSLKTMISCCQLCDVRSEVIDTNLHGLPPCAAPGASFGNGHLLVLSIKLRHWPR